MFTFNAQQFSQSIKQPLHLSSSLSSSICKRSHQITNIMSQNKDSSDCPTAAFKNQPRVRMSSQKNMEGSKVKLQNLIETSSFLNKQNDINNINHKNNNVQKNKTFKTKTQRTNPTRSKGSFEFADLRLIKTSKHNCRYSNYNQNAPQSEKQTLNTANTKRSSREIALQINEEAHLSKKNIRKESQKGHNRKSLASSDTPIIQYPQCDLKLPSVFRSRRKSSNSKNFIAVEGSIKKRERASSAQLTSHVSKNKQILKIPNDQQSELIQMKQSAKENTIFRNKVLMSKNYEEFPFVFTKLRPQSTLLMNKLQKSDGRKSKSKANQTIESENSINPSSSSNVKFQQQFQQQQISKNQKYFQILSSKNTNQQNVPPQIFPKRLLFERRSIKSRKTINQAKLVRNWKNLEGQNAKIDLNNSLYTDQISISSNLNEEAFLDKRKSSNRISNRTKSMHSYHHRKLREMNGDLTNCSPNDSNSHIALSHNSSQVLSVRSSQNEGCRTKKQSSKLQKGQVYQQ